MRPLLPARRPLLRAVVLTSALALSTALPVLGLAPAAYAQSGTPVRGVAPAEECKPDDQACKDREANAKEAAEIEKAQKKNQDAADRTDKDIKAAGDKLKECPPGSASCMEKLTSNGTTDRAESGISDMTGAIDSFKPDPSDNAASAVESTCADFPASLPAGAADDSHSAFPVSQLCSLLGS
ncbi:hypothetical protein ACIQZB_22415 [Streptomyces sp. NPDC097727]|uniref:hypothetical protein n=1 Tax=Streptomyces sp. NPDC097727 TaxID=3366092 RepID=UPI0037FA5A6C